MKLKELWKPVKRYEGKYEISDKGRVRSLNYMRTGKVKVMKPQIDRNGYLYVQLCKNGITKNLKVHKLVVEGFIGLIPKGMVVNHINEDKSDNRLSNLEIVTHKENINWGTRNERTGKANSKQLDLIEVDWPYCELTFSSSIKASEFFNYNSKNAVGTLISQARKRGENHINIKGTRYIFAQSGC